MTTDQILDDLLAAQDTVTALEEQADTARQIRDAYLVRARKAGKGATELARLTGLSRARVNQILAAANLAP